MNQNLVTLNLSDEQFASIDTTLSELERQLASLVAITPANKRRVRKMGSRSEAFCRQVLRMLSENPQMVPGNLDLADAVADLQALDRFRPRLMRLMRLTERASDTNFGLGSDVMDFAAKGYGLLKLVGQSEGLDGLRRNLGAHFSRRAREEKQAA
jgi:hypothetical protein